MQAGIDVAFTLEELAHTSLAGTAAVMIDVIRASTTIVTALANGARAVAPVVTPEEAVARSRRWPGETTVLGGERRGAPPPGFDCGNSPAEYTGDRVRGRTVVFTTTNGTRALLALGGARRVAVGAFVNARAVVTWLAREPGPVLFVCAGELGRFCLEDAACAGLLVERLRARWAGAPVSDAAQAAAVLYGYYRDDPARVLADAAWARALLAEGRGGDLPLCAAIDVFDLVPVARDGLLVAGTGAAIDTFPGGPP